MTDIEQVREALRTVVASGANSFRNGGRWDDVTIARSAYDSAVAALAAAVPEGWQLVPKEPTEEMVKALLPKTDSVFSDDLMDMFRDVVQRDYAALLAAALPPPAAEEEKPKLRFYEDDGTGKLKLVEP